MWGPQTVAVLVFNSHNYGLSYSELDLMECKTQPIAGGEHIIIIENCFGIIQKRFLHNIILSFMIYNPVCLSIYLSIFLSIDPSIYLSICLPVYLSIYLYF